LLLGHRRPTQPRAKLLLLARRQLNHASGTRHATNVPELAYNYKLLPEHCTRPNGARPTGRRQAAAGSERVDAVVRMPERSTSFWRAAVPMRRWIGDGDYDAERLLARRSCRGDERHAWGERSKMSEAAPATSAA